MIYHILWEDNVTLDGVSGVLFGTNVGEGSAADNQSNMKGQ